MNLEFKFEILVSESKSWRRRREDICKLRFPVRADHHVEIESASLKILAPPLPGKRTVDVKIYQKLGTRRRRFLEEKTLYVSPSDPKWVDIDVTAPTKDWLEGSRNLGLELECQDCEESLKPLKAALSAVVYPKGSRQKRSLSSFRMNRRSECRPGDPKKKCCRHSMNVTFAELKVPQMSSIVQPKTYEAGFCKGRCPPNYNYATNHSRIQSMVRRFDRSAPRVCCAPSKLEPLEILRVDPFDSTKLALEKWDNMIVVECACS